MFAQLINTLKKSPKTIVFTEGTDPRILEASARLLSGNFLKPVLVGNPDEIAAAAEDIGFNIRGAEIIDPENFDGMDEMVDEMVALRKGKMTADECRAALKKSNYFGTMLVKMGKADCLLGGATYSTADTVRPALQLIKTKPGNKIVHKIVRGRLDDVVSEIAKIAACRVVSACRIMQNQIANRLQSPRRVIPGVCARHLSFAAPTAAASTIPSDMI